MSDVPTIINRVIIDVLRDMPYYGHVLCQLTKIYSDSIGTLGVGRKRDGMLLNLYVSPTYVQSVFKKAPSTVAAYSHLAEVMKHECLHVIFGHLFLNLPDKHRQEIACELSVNSYIDRNRLVDKGVFPQDYKLPEKLGVMEYYNRLPPTQKITLMLDSHGEWKGCQVEGSSGINAADPQLETLVKDILRKAKDACNTLDSWGNMPSELREMIDQATAVQEQKVDWQTILRSFLSSSAETALDYTNRRPSRRYGTRPGTRKEEELRVAIGIDTSGSIDGYSLAMFFSELYWIHRQGAQITVFECDCQIGREYDFRDLDLSSITGGGGTDLEPVFREASDRGFDALIYFTDGYAPKIQENYNIPTILVLPEDSVHRREDLPVESDFVFHVRKTGEVDVV